MISIKNGAKVNGLRSEILIALMVATSILEEDNYNCIITEGTGGKHGRGSKHYIGNGIDLRSRHIPPSIQDGIRERIATALGEQYDVVLEKDHYHIEFDPK